MIIKKHVDHVSILHNETVVLIKGHAVLIYEENGLTVIVNSIPEMFFNNVDIKDITSDITIELE